MTPSAYEDGHLLSRLPSIPQCEPCIVSKSIHHVPKQLSHDRTSHAFELIHSDLSGIAPVPSLGGSQYYMAFIDDYTGCISSRLNLMQA